MVLREKGEDAALQAIAAMMQGTVVELDAELAIEAAFLGHQEKLAFADSILFAIAKKTQRAPLDAG